MLDIPQTFCIQHLLSNSYDKHLQLQNVIFLKFSSEWFFLRNLKDMFNRFAADYMTLSITAIHNTDTFVLCVVFCGLFFVFCLPSW